MAASLVDLCYSNHAVIAIPNRHILSESLNWIGMSIRWAGYSGSCQIASSCVAAKNAAFSLISLEAMKISMISWTRNILPVKVVTANKILHDIL